ncbi:hypothetical protein PLESTB_001000400 [Pleodorina starrii]|uniref:C2 domain-containing protein n=1 Tax=Pleodorina starrii TaxID=330485 RepID=A0A9W6F457_9CHLO|nr:hypothetical protein PLESTB_001000400 [Pleodorina starrii]
MGSQRPLGCASGIRRTVTPVQLPAACLRGSSSRKLGCLKRRLVRPSAAIGFSDAIAGPWSDADVSPLPATVSSDVGLSPSSSALPAVSHGHSHRQSAHPEQARMQQQQQKHEAAQQVVQRLVPPTPVASATTLPTRSWVSVGGVALGVLLTVALQLVGRWLQRQRWAQQLMEMMELRRSSGSSASTSGKHDGAGAASRRPGGSTSRPTSGEVSGSGAGDSVDGAGAANRSAFLGGSTGSLPGSPLGTLDGGGYGAGAAEAAGSPLASASSLPATDPGESVEWVNMCWRKVWRVYQRGLERWIIDLLQPLFDGLVKDGSVPRWLCRLRVVELTLDHEAPYFSNMRRRNSRKDSDLNGVVDLRYTGGARMLLMLELGEGRWRFKVPVLVSDLDLECQMWLKLRLAPMCPWIGTISLAFVGPPNVKVQLSPYNRVRLMRVPVVQNYLRKLLTVDLPGLMVLPQRLEINIPPSVTTIAEAAVGRDTIMRAVASAVLQADAVEAALLAALPLGPQTPAGGVTLPEAFKVSWVPAGFGGWGVPCIPAALSRTASQHVAQPLQRLSYTSLPASARRHRASTPRRFRPYLLHPLGLYITSPAVLPAYLAVLLQMRRNSSVTLRYRSRAPAYTWISPPTPPHTRSLRPPLAPRPSLPLQGELSVTLQEARDLPVWGFPGQSNPYCRLVLGEQAVQSRREGDTSHPGRHRAPVWNQEFQFLVEDPNVQVLEMVVKDSHLTGRTEVGRASIRLADILAAQHKAEGGKVTMWVPLQPLAASYGITGGEAVPTGDVLVELSYKAFDDDEQDSGYREAENYSKQAAAQAPITDIRSAAAASSRAAVAASAAASAIAMTRAAAARAAARAARAAQEAAAAAAGAAKGAVDQGASIIAREQHQHQQQPAAPPKQLPAPTKAPAAAAPAAAAAETSGAAPSASAAAGTSAVAEVADGAADGADSGRASGGGAVEGGNGAGALTHVAAATVMAAAPGRRIRVTEEVEEVDAAAPRQLQEEAAAMAVASASATVAAAAPAAVQSRTATAVLERPPATSEPHVVGDDSGSSNGQPYDEHRHSYDDGASGGSRWRHRQPGGDAGPASDAGDGESGSRGDGGDAAAAALSVEVLEPLPYQSAGGGADAPGPHPPPQKRHPEEQVIDVAAAAEVVAGPGAGGSGAKAQGQVPGGGAAGPVLSALAHLTASAHSLTATAIDKAKETISHQKQQQQARSAQEEEAAAATAKELRGSGEGGNWLEAIVSRLPKYGGGSGGSPQHHHAASEEEEETAGGGAATAAASGRTADGEDEHPWWQFWVPKGGAAKIHDAAADGAAEATEAAAASPQRASDGRVVKPWWQFWSDGGKDAEAEERRVGGPEDGGSKDGGSKPVEAIYIPPDLPLEEIAAEVQRLKEDSWRERSDHVSGLWMKAVERNDRKWLMLAAFLLSVAVGLLTVVAWRLEQLEHLQAAAPQVALLTMQAALQVLEQHASGGGGGLL